MSRLKASRVALFALLRVLLAGCSRSEQTPENAAAGKSRGADVSLTVADLERFLAVVQNHSEALIPEFTPPDEDESLDMDAPAAELVTSYRGEVNRLFDAARQGAIWEHDTQWSQALSRQHTSAKKIAGRVRKVTL